MEQSDKSIYNLRHDFSMASLDEKEVHLLPAMQFGLWMDQALEAKIGEAQAMVLSTVSTSGKPSARVLYLREYGDNNFAFFTNYQSRKSEELSNNQQACLTFFWPELERQIRIEGIVEKHSKEASDSYFYSRPHHSKIGAWSSPQSKILKNRKELDDLVTDFDKKYPTEDVPRPDFWGGYVLKANYYEFWQGRASRLHDRIVYTLQNGGSWKIERLAP
ncbi:MAG: pdxH [Bacteroidetes bacterium]|jgi:pyridoxamine 5'-phosphate oxidase|nr:pdxH [Bacteroidota bacterium]